MGRVLEGLWDCPYCDFKGISGLKTTCPNCDTTRDENVKFYLGSERNYLDEKTIKEVGTNPDWLCSYCDCLNNDKFSECQECGATREASKLNYFENLKKKEEKRKSFETSINEPIEEHVMVENANTEIDTFASSFENQTKQTKSEPNTTDIVLNKEQSFKTKPKRNFNSSKIIKITAVVMSALLLLTGLIFLLIPKTVEGTVSGFEWERNITIEEFKTVDESSWTLPAGARLHYTKQEISGYKNVISHYETKTRTYTEEVLDHYDTVVVGHRDNGNGTFSEITNEIPVYRTETRTETYQEPVYKEEPIYQTKYYYEIDKWVYKNTIKTHGNDQKPEWGTYQCKEKEREGGRSEKYFIILQYEDKTKDFELSFNEWNSLKKGDKVKLKTHVTGEAKIIHD